MINVDDDDDDDDEDVVFLFTKPLSATGASAGASAWASAGASAGDSGYRPVSPVSDSPSLSPEIVFGDEKDTVDASKWYIASTLKTNEIVQGVPVFSTDIDETTTAPNTTFIAFESTGFRRRLMAIPVPVKSDDPREFDQPLLSFSIGKRPIKTLNTSQDVLNFDTIGKFCVTMSDLDWLSMTATVEQVSTPMTSGNPFFATVSFSSRMCKTGLEIIPVSIQLSFL
jgi:hypothetical protein